MALKVKVYGSDAETIAKRIEKWTEIEEPSMRSCPRSCERCAAQRKIAREAKSERSMRLLRPC